MLTLPIKRCWFDMIASGKKLEEYRNMTPRYKHMFENAADEHGRFWCQLRNGYRFSSPTLTVYVQFHIGTGRAEWGAEPGKEYFVLSILEIK